eukprot:Skav209578  [mRNA]  locus=scaffold281:240155:240481:+ [translate_table: standard]
MYKSVLRTPALFDWCFVGHEHSTIEGAENSVCLNFFLDTEVDEIARWLVPGSKVIKAYIGTFFRDLTQRERILNCSIDKKLIQEEATQDLVLLCKAAGCRCALWDGNA